MQKGILMVFFFFFQITVVGKIGFQAKPVFDTEQFDPFLAEIKSFCLQQKLF